VAKPFQKIEIDMDLLVSLKDQGKSWQKIGKELGCSATTANKRYNKYYQEMMEKNKPHAEAIQTAAQLVTPDEKKTQTSKPWDSNYNPWTLDRLHLPKLHEGFHPVFIRKKDVDYVRMREEQGFQIANCYDYGLTPRESKGDKFKDSSVDETVQRGDLILAELPHHLWLKREEYKRRKAQKQQSRSRDEVERANAELKREGIDMKVTQEEEHTSFRTPETFTTTSTKDI